jgi:DNA repair exonuclease SbcCD ATPase subunit
MSYGKKLADLRLDHNCCSIAVIGKDLDNPAMRNGVGKTALMEALVYGLFGKSLSNISQDRLINNINKKGLLVEVVFEKDNTFYKVQRVRKGKTGSFVKVFKYLDGNIDGEGEEISKDSIHNTNSLIEKILGISYELFIRIVVFSANSKSFFELPISPSSGKQTEGNQTNIIEEMFGLVELSRRGENLKELIKENNALLKAEKREIEFLEESKQNNEKKLDETKQKIKEWEVNHKQQLAEYKQKADTWKKQEEEKVELQLNKRKQWQLDLDKTISELKASTKQADIEHKKRISKIEADLKGWDRQQNNTIAKFKDKISQIDKAAIEHDLENLDKISVLEKEIDEISEKIRKINDRQVLLDKELEDDEKKLASFEECTCPTCHQKYEEAKQQIPELTAKIEKIVAGKKQIEGILENLKTDSTNKLKEVISLKENLKVKDLDEKLKIYNNLQLIEEKIKNLEQQVNPYKEALEQEKNWKNNVESEIESLKKQQNPFMFDYVIPEINPFTQSYEDKVNEINPFKQVYEELSSAMVLNIDYTKINDLKKLLDHQNFLYKLLTKKTSFVRKVMLDSHIPYLNEKIAEYLDSLNMVHTVRFKHDLTTEIKKYSSELDYGNMSSGQQARINIALNLAFRDILQKMYGTIDLMILDEILDRGLDSIGVEAAARMIKQKAKDEKATMFIITHRSELDSMFDKKLLVYIEDGFSNFRLEDS